jgi:short-subunit dehydrogenase
MPLTRPHRSLVNRRALVTGASSGIGRALAIALAERGADLVLFARRQDRLEEVAREISKLGRRAVPVAGDVTDSSARRRALDAAQNEFGGLDILVNNAGVAAHGRFAEADPGRLRPIMEVNFFAPVELIRESLPLLRAGTQPMIVNVGSILGERGCPHKSEYSASKFALHGFSEAVRPELARLGIDVLVVAAGPTETEHFDNLIEDRGELPWRNPSRTPAQKVAQEIVRAIELGRHKVITGRRSRIWVLLNRLSPRLVDWIMARYG